MFANRVWGAAYFHVACTVSSVTGTGSDVRLLCPVVPVVFLIAGWTIELRREYKGGYDVRLRRA